MVSGLVSGLASGLATCLQRHVILDFISVCASVFSSGEDSESLPAIHQRRAVRAPNKGISNDSNE